MRILSLTFHLLPKSTKICAIGLAFEPFTTSCAHISLAAKVEQHPHWYLHLFKLGLLVVILSPKMLDLN